MYYDIPLEHIAKSINPLNYVNNMEIVNIILYK